ncbi:dolichol phosphate-mannose biosynthesis regulatory protein [Nephila pilipes]|uniref:Dolichol phosphate-mannose biosynthesis regulatory protein n=1 Tax=Nephila pilipes TaxID=299642 RepID=A0A8X6NJ61_NEPPI|nr:dolichol phosphate-mannose biosynthesis regulatory protein [Nephila pilipes]
MSAKVGCWMILSGIGLFIAITLKLIVQPFIAEDHHIHAYFPSTEWVLGIPVILGFMFLLTFTVYIYVKTLRENIHFFSYGE